MDAEQPKMTRAEFDRLLSAYSTGSIRDDERETLFQAAMDDQSLFNALADEESLRDVLQDPAFAKELRKELAPPATRPFWLRPWSLVAAGTLATVVLGTFFFWRAQIPLSPGLMASRVAHPEAPPVATPPSAASAPAAKRSKAAKKPDVEHKPESPVSDAVLSEPLPAQVPPAPAASQPPAPRAEPEPVKAEEQRTAVIAGAPPAGVAGAQPRLSALRESVQLDTAIPKRVFLASQATGGKPFQHSLAQNVLTVTAHRDGYLYVLALIGGEWKTLESGAQIASGVSRPVPMTEATQALIALTPQPVPDPTPANLRKIPGLFVETITVR